MLLDYRSHGKISEMEDTFLQSHTLWQMDVSFHVKSSRGATLRLRWALANAKLRVVDF